MRDCVAQVIRGGAANKMTDKIGHGDEAERKYKVWLRAETVGLVAVILIVWGLLILPVVIYFLPVVSGMNV